MRKLPLLTLALAACGRISAPEPAADTILYRSTFEGSTNGLVLHEDGDGGHAGMFGTNCPFETITGSVTGDYDLPGEDEDVQDGEATTLGEITLAATITGTVHVLDKTDGVYTHVEVPIDGVSEGRLTGDGVVGITPACDLTWVGFDNVLRHHLTVDRCGGEIETDPETGVTIVTDPSGTVVTDGQTTTPAEADGDLVAFDDVVRRFYVATRGESHLAALDLEGATQWTVETPGPVTALDDGGGTGTAAVIVELDDGRGAVVFYDGLTGERVHYAETPSPAEDLSVSGNGKVVALVRPEQTFFYELVD